MMNKKRKSMEKMVAWVLIAYAISLIVGETLRNQVFPEQSRKRKLFSGPSLFIKLKLNLLPNEFQDSAAKALVSFLSIVFPVRSLV